MNCELTELKEYSIMVDKDILPQFVEECKKYSHLIPYIDGEFKNHKEWWIVKFFDTRKEKED